MGCHHRGGMPASRLWWLRRGRLLRPGLVVYCDRPEPSMVASSGLHHLSDYAYKDTTIF
nr:hypothetical protein [Prevotella sp.]